ncbi:hypothetical protein ACWEQC_39685 [Streptomyces shenzhenensis]
MTARTYAVAPGVPGLARRTLLCGLGVHGRKTEHAALARAFLQPAGGGAWVFWSDGAAPSWGARPDCPNRPPGKPPCNLFACHFGLCTFSLSSIPAEDSTRPHRIDDALAVLAEPARHGYDIQLRAGHDAALLAWDELRARRIWEQLAPWDQAAVYRRVSLAQVPRTAPDRGDAVGQLVRGAQEITQLWASGTSDALPGGDEAVTLWEALTQLPKDWQVHVVGGQCSVTPGARIPFPKAIRTAAEHTAAGHEPPRPGLHGWSTWNAIADQQHGTAEVGRLARLPYGWQVDLVRRVCRGDPFSVGDADQSISMLRSYGIDVRGTEPAEASAASQSGRP